MVGWSHDENGLMKPRWKQQNFEATTNIEAYKEIVFSNEGVESFLRESMKTFEV